MVAYPEDVEGEIGIACPWVSYHKPNPYTPSSVIMQIQVLILKATKIFHGVVSREKTKQNAFIHPFKSVIPCLSALS